MRIASLLSALALWMALAPPAQAGLHLGMKLACKRYGDAWNSGSQSALWGATTGDFASVWNRMPADMYGFLAPRRTRKSPFQQQRLWLGHRYCRNQSRGRYFSGGWPRVQLDGRGYLQGAVMTVEPFRSRITWTPA